MGHKAVHVQLSYYTQLSQKSKAPFGVVLLFSVVTLTVAVPFERPVTTPFDEIDITFGLLELSISHLNPILAFAVLGYIVVAY